MLSGTRCPGSAAEHRSLTGATERGFVMSSTLPRIPFLTLGAARRVADAALQAADERKLKNLTIAIVDPGSALLVLLRQDQSPPGCVEIGIGKARTSVQFRQPTNVWKARLEGGAKWVAAVPGLYPMNGGFPILCEGHVVGGIGVAGATGALDEEIAQLAASIALE
jgi:glc operon protein GlcG